MTRLAAAILALAAFPALGARPLTTDDASILDDKQCQLEAGLDFGHSVTLGSFVPACNFGAGIEWEIGVTHARAMGDTQLVEGHAQAKIASRLGEGPWSLGAVAGVTRREVESSVRRWDNPFALALVTGEFGALVAHGNLGWSRDRDTGRDVTPWGLAIEGNVHPRLTLLAEAFGVNREKPFLRAGLRHAAIAERLDLDLSVLSRAGGGRSDRLIAIGFNYQTGRLIP